MCGIVGILDRKPVAMPLLKKMTHTIRHRGPDAENWWIKGPVGFGHTRLSIIDLSERASQPMQSEDGNFVLVYNGEIYNFQNLRLELQRLGYSFFSDCDTEVVLKAYQHWGAGCIEKFNGMFAFAIWDQHKQKLFMARDRYGVKPLYYYNRGGLLVFASEIKAIIQHPEVNPRVDIRALNEYFSFQNVFSDLTLFEHIHILQPGHYAILDRRDKPALDIHQYWDFRYRDVEHFSQEKIYVNEVRRLFEEATTRQLVSDVEIGSFLSGGMDSGAITSIAARNFPDLKTFTCGFDLSDVSMQESSFDERRKAEFLSNLVKTEHYEVVLKAGDMERVMDDLVWHIEDLRVGQCYPNYYVSRLAGKFVKVALSGAGGDEIFAGYPWRYYRAVTNDNFDDYADKYYRYWQRLIPDSYKPRFFQPDVFPEVWNYQTRDVFRDVLGGIMRDDSGKITPEDYVNYSLYFESKTFLHGLLMVDDKLSMAHGLETRVPFLDNELVDFAMTIPVKYKLMNLREVVRQDENEPGRKAEKYFQKTRDGKIVLRNMLSQYIPGEFTGGIKQGFSAPDATWFRRESRKYIEDMFFRKKARIYDYLRPATVRELIEEHFNDTKNRRLLIWSLISFETWLKHFIP